MTTQSNEFTTAQKSTITAIRSSVKNGVTIAGNLNKLVEANQTTLIQGLIDVFYTEKENARIKAVASNKKIKAAITAKLTKEEKLTGKPLAAAISSAYKDQMVIPGCANWDAARKAVARAYAKQGLTATTKGGKIATVKTPAPTAQQTTISSPGLMDTVQTCDKIRELLNSLQEIGASAEISALTTEFNTVNNSIKDAARLKQVG